MTEEGCVPAIPSAEVGTIGSDPSHGEENSDEESGTVRADSLGVESLGMNEDRNVPAVTNAEVGAIASVRSDGKQSCDEESGHQGANSPRVVSLTMAEEVSVTLYAVPYAEVGALGIDSFYGKESFDEESVPVGANSPRVVSLTMTEEESVCVYDVPYAEVEAVGFEKSGPVRADSLESLGMNEAEVGTIGQSSDEESGPEGANSPRVVSLTMTEEVSVTVYGVPYAEEGAIGFDHFYEKESFDEEAGPVRADSLESLGMSEAEVGTIGQSSDEESGPEGANSLRVVSVRMAEEGSVPLYAIVNAEVGTIGSDVSCGEENTDEKSESVQRNTGSNDDEEGSINVSEISGEESEASVGPSGRNTPNDQSENEETESSVETGDADVEDESNSEIDEYQAVDFEINAIDEDVGRAYNLEPVIFEVIELPFDIEDENPRAYSPFFDPNEAMGHAVIDYLMNRSDCQCYVHRAGIPTYPNTCIPMPYYDRAISPESSSSSD